MCRDEGLEGGFWEIVELNDLISFAVGKCFCLLVSFFFFYVPVSTAFLWGVKHTFFSLRHPFSDSRLKSYLEITTLSCRCCIAKSSWPTRMLHPQATVMSSVPSFDRGQVHFYLGFWKGRLDLFFFNLVAESRAPTEGQKAHSSCAQCCRGAWGETPFPVELLKFSLENISFNRFHTDLQMPILLWKIT